jgi:hypothetical protein
MKTLNRLAELKTKVNNAETYNADGRQVVAMACRKLYNTIEDGLYKKYGVNAVNDAYEDLCNGNFAEPFMCELKKGRFELYRTVYIKNVLPKLN